MIFSRKWSRTTEQEIQKNSKGPIITLIVIHFADDFRSDIGDLHIKLLTVPTHL